MNRKLKKLAVLVSDTARPFDYRSLDSCVFPLVKEVLGLPPSPGAMSHEDMAFDMGVTSDELGYLQGGCWPDIDPTPHKSWSTMRREDAYGDAGRTEALRRIGVVARSR